MTPSNLANLRELLCCLREGQLSPEQAIQLDGLLSADPEARLFYVRYMDLCANLFWSVLSDDGHCQLMTQVLEAPKSEVPPSSPFPSLLDTMSHGATGYFSGWPVAYLVATVIFGIGLLVGALVHVSQPAQVARQSSVPSRVEVERKTELVGQITGMVDCKWVQGPESRVESPALDSRLSTLVSLGDKFALSSGLLEITYDTGAKVILQGPATYEMEANGGYLSVGKLTGKLEKKNEECGMMNDELRTGTSGIHHLSFITHPLFVVRTPTATVTDLGTEFGVEVHESGSTTAYVFRGVVQVQPDGVYGKQGGRAVRLIENESVRVEKQGSGEAVKVDAAKADPAAFVRFAQLPKLAEEQRLKPLRRWQTYSNELRRDPSLVAYYDFQQKEGLPAVLPNVAQNGRGLSDGEVENATWSNGRMPGKHALLFNGPSDLVRIDLPQKTADLTLAAWVSFDSLDHTKDTGFLMSTGWEKPGQIHWDMDNASGQMGVCVVPNGCWGAVFDIHNRLRRWTHLACVYDHATKQWWIYVDGRSTANGIDATLGPFAIGPACIGCWDRAAYSHMAPRYLRGKIDELAIFGRPLRAGEVRQMYEEGKP